MATLIKVNAKPVRLTPAKGETFKLKELQAIVGGYIEMVRLTNGRWLVCNEEGKLQDLPINPVATRYCQDNGLDDTIVGDVLIVSDVEVD